MTETYPKSLIDEIETIKQNYRTSLDFFNSEYDCMIKNNKTELRIYTHVSTFNTHAFKEFEKFLSNNETKYELYYEKDEDDSMGFHFRRPYHKFTFYKKDYPQKNTNKDPLCGIPQHKAVGQILASTKNNKRSIGLSSTTGDGPCN